jgi:RNA polymerase sigma-70 factor (ECF subfamily)
LLQDTAESPEGNLLHAEQHHLLHQAVLRIPVQLRIVLVLHDMEELTTEQVAQILDLQPGTVRVRLHRARLSVRKEMNGIVERAPAPLDCGKPLRMKSKRIAPKGGQRPAECRELFLNLSEYLDGNVEPRTCDQMRQHIDACPACVAFLRDLRAAIDRCRSLEVPCDSAVAPRLRSILTQEYLRLLGLPSAEKVLAVL